MSRLDKPTLPAEDVNTEGRLGSRASKSSTLAGRGTQPRMMATSSEDFDARTPSGAVDRTPPDPGGSAFCDQSKDGELDSGVGFSPEASLARDAESGSGSPLEIGHRVDALVVAYRVRVSDAAIDQLRDAQGKATHFGQAELRLPIPGADHRTSEGWAVAGVRRSRSERMTFENADLRGQFVEALAGIRGEEPGWCLELVARAVYLASHDISDVVTELRTWASAFGDVYEERLRRVDLCADFERWPIREEDGGAFVRAPRSTLTTHVDGDDDRLGREERKTYRTASQRVTGHTVCPGNVVMARIYDKTQELSVHVDQSKEALERAIWSENGWTGGRVTRVEFQVRGEACQELLGRSVERMVRERAELWAYCSSKWLRLVVPEEATRLRRCPTDARWQAVQAVPWAGERSPLRRVRHRGMATVQQAWGTVVTGLAQTGCMPAVGEEEIAASMVAQDATPILRSVVMKALDAFGELVETVLVTRNENDAAQAVEWVIRRMQAATARAESERRSSRKGDCTDGARCQLESDLEGARCVGLGINGPALPGAQSNPLAVSAPRNAGSVGRHGDMAMGVERWDPAALRIRVLATRACSSGDDANRRCTNRHSRQA